MIYAPERTIHIILSLVLNNAIFVCIVHVDVSITSITLQEPIYSNDQSNNVGCFVADVKENSSFLIYVVGIDDTLTNSTVQSNAVDGVSVIESVPVHVNEYARFLSFLVVFIVSNVVVLCFIANVHAVQEVTLTIYLTYAQDNHVNRCDSVFAVHAVCTAHVVHSVHQAQTVRLPIVVRYFSDINSVHINELPINLSTLSLLIHNTLSHICIPFIYQLVALYTGHNDDDFVAQYSDLSNDSKYQSFVSQVLHNELLQLKIGYH